MKEQEMKRKKKKKSLRRLVLPMIGWTLFTVVVAGGVIWFFIQAFGEYDYLTKPTLPETTTDAMVQVSEVESSNPVTEPLAPTEPSSAVIQTVVMGIHVEDETQTETPAPTKGPSIPVGERKYLFLGDSRFDGMRSFCPDGNDIYITEVGRGYEYLVAQKDNAMAQGGPNTALIIGLGVNGVPAFAAEMAATLNQMAESYSGKIFFTTVNPVDEAKEASHGYYITNASINAFNQVVTAALSPKVIVIDTNTYMQQNGFVSTDGVHYPLDVTTRLHQYIKASVDMYM